MKLPNSLKVAMAATAIAWVLYLGLVLVAVFTGHNADTGGALKDAMDVTAFVAFALTFCTVMVFIGLSSE